MSVIIDGMDQNSTHLPHSKRVQKSDSNLWHFRTHLTGSIVHGHSGCVFLDYMQWPHDPNLTVTILCEVSRNFLQCIINCLFTQVILAHLVFITTTPKETPFAVGQHCKGEQKSLRFGILGIFGTQMHI